MLQNKKILVVATTDNMISQFLIPHIEYLKSQGNVVECACNKTGFWFDELQEKHNIKCHQIGFARNPLKPANMGYICPSTTATVAMMRRFISHASLTASS